MAVGVVMFVSHILSERAKVAQRVLSINTQNLAEAEQAYEMGFKYYRGGGDVLIDHSLAFADFSKAAELGLPEAQARLADLLGQKYGLDFRAPDEQKAGEWAKKALASGLLEKAEAQKHRAEYELAIMYLHGSGVNGSYTKAAELYERAAKHGDGDAKRALGFLHMGGKGVEKNYKTAERYFLEAAAERIAPAELFLGLLYHGGEKDISKDHAKAAEMFRKASDQGLTAAHEQLGKCYERGEGVAQDFGKAAELYKKGADRGYWSALLSLGGLYERGEGVPKDLEKAAELFQKVADQGIKAGREALERVKPSKSP
jgi:TPR repeat protein